MFQIDGAEIESICKAFNIKSLYLFGSVSRGDNSSLSDIDLIVNFNPSDDPLGQYFGAKEAFQSVFNRRVDLVEEGGIRGSRFGEKIKADRIVLYEA